MSSHCFVPLVSAYSQQKPPVNGQSPVINTFHVPIDDEWLGASDDCTDEWRENDGSTIKQVQTRVDGVVDTSHHRSSNLFCDRIPRIRGGFYIVAMGYVGDDFAIRKV